MSDEEDDGEESTIRLALECECCRAIFRPEDLGYASLESVPLDARCPRCFCAFAEVELDEPGDANPPGG